MIANLPMYDRPELDTANLRFWHLIRQALYARGIEAPENLAQSNDMMAVWTDPSLVLSQTCGMPYRKHLHGKVNLVGTPDYDLPDCPAGHYYSVIVVRKTDPRTALKDFENPIFAFNEEISQSGFAAPLNHAAAQGVRFDNRIQSFGHAISAKMVATGQADIAALDAVTWTFVDRYDEFAKDLRVLEITAPPTPVLPFITSTNHDPDLIFGAIEQAIKQLTADEKAALSLKGIIKIPAEDYLSVPNP